MSFNVIAMLEVYNDEDIVEELIQHIKNENLHLVVFDNGSTDDTLNICKKFLNNGIDKLFSIGSNSWELSRDLRIQYDLALTLSPDWVIRFDSDEFLETGIKGINLHDGILEADKQGYNIIQFDWFNFFLTDDDKKEGSTKDRLRYYSWASEFQFRAWKVAPGIRSEENPHLPIFPDFLKYKIYPKKFVLRHYPFRSKLQAEKKLLARLAKIKNKNAEVELGMHFRYKIYSENKFPPIVNHQTLSKYKDDNNWNLELTHLPFPNFRNHLIKKENLFSKDGKLLKERPSILDYRLKLKKLRENNLKLKTINQNLNEKFNLENEKNHKEDYKKTVKIYWVKSGTNNKNFGDWITSYIFEKITGEKPIWNNKKNSLDPTYFGSGSILQKCKGWKNIIIWGSGIIDSQSTFDEPTKVLCVRGPLTRKRFLELGYSCPEIYGDPGLLLPRFYHPKISKKYKIGIIPHYVDFDFCKVLFSNLENIKIIDVCNDVEKVVDEICECEMTISSSLHGIIVSHAYNIESCWIKFSNSILGDDVKFLDYYYSLNLNQVKAPVVVNDNFYSKNDPINYLIDWIQNFPNPTFPLTTEKLLKTCPFFQN
jgi:glycosyltransferase involved in cell wall biosynthesis